MSRKMNDLTISLKILDKSITKLDQVMDNQILIKRIMEEKHGD